MQIFVIGALVVLSCALCWILLSGHRRVNGGHFV